MAGGFLFLLNDFQFKFPTKCPDHYPGAILTLGRTGQVVGCRLSLLMWLEGVETSKSPKKGGEEGGKSLSRAGLCSSLHLFVLK